MTIEHEEKRDFIRMEAQHSLQFSEIGTENLQIGTCHNLSATGIMFTAESAIPMGTELEVNITPQYALTSPFDAVVKVVRSGPNGSPDTFAIAGKITSIKPLQ